MKRLAAVTALVLAAAAVGTLVRTPGSALPATRTSALADSASAEPAPLAPAMRIAPAAPARPSEATTAAEPTAVEDPVHAVTAAIAAGDDLDIVVAVEAAVDANATAALPALSGIDLRRAPHAAPAIIQGIATLAKDAGPGARRDAASTLARWFRQERQREGADAEGNTSVLIEALADTEHREAIDTLLAALDEHSLPLAAETLLVQRLAGLGNTVSRPGITRWQARVSALPASEGLDEELRVEALGAATEALAHLGG